MKSVPYDARAVVAACFLLSGNCSQALTSAEFIYVADVNTGAIKKFDSTGHGSAFGSVGVVNPVDLALDAAGNLYVANRSGGVSGTIDRFDPAGHRSLFANVWFPSGLAFGGDGSLYAGMLGNNSVERFDSTGQATIFATSGLNSPVAIAFDHAGNLYVANQNDSSIVKFNSAGQESFFAYSGQYPSGLAFDSGDNLFVANFGDNTVQKIDPAGNSSTFAGLSLGLNAPVDLAFDGAGNLFVLNLGNNTIEKFDPAGHASLFANTAMDHPQTLAIRIVPEPSSWALLGLGAGALVIRRRRFSGQGNTDDSSSRQNVSQS